MKTILLGCFSLFTIGMGLAIGGTLSSCSEDKEITEEVPFLKIDNKTINMEEDGGEIIIAVKTNKQYTIAVAQGGEWCKATQQPDGVLLKISPNDDKDVRRTTIDITSATLKETIQVAQLGWGKAILLSPANATVSAAGGDVKVEITTNLEYGHSIGGGDWLKDKPQSRSEAHPVKTNMHTFVANPNEGAQRVSTIVFADKDEASDFDPVTFTVTQSSINDYQQGSADEVKDDIKVKVASGEASKSQPGEGIEKSFDGDMTTIYHSPWDNSTGDYFPITLTYNFEQGSDMDYFVYYPRTDGWNGLFKEVDIEVMSNANSRGANEWKKVMTYDFGGSSVATRVDFPEPQIGVAAVRFTVKSGAGDKQGFASCAEMEFYKKNPENFDWQALFTDASCSALKPGITDADIQECKYSLFRNVAYYMLHDTYPSKFRIAGFKSYPHPDLQSRTHKTNAYSLLDNPTGIAVQEGDFLVVAADLKGQKVSIKVQNLDKPGGDGFGGDSYPLIQGINKIKMQNKGLVYVMYHTNDFTEQEKVQLHFITGKVNGYYDSQNPDLKDKYQELLDNATDKYFDVVGKYAHLTFPTSRFKSHTKDLKKLIDFYDELVYREQEFMGLTKYGKEFKNRMYFNVMYHSYMYATSYHTGYHDETLPQLCDDANIKSAIWGPAHEVGHCNQTRPGLMWLGTTEVTNNIMSEYIQTTVFGEESRVQVEDMGNKVASNRYATAWNGIIADGIPHATHGDVFCKLIPFWQLELYMGKVKGRTPMQQADKGGFYADVYEHVRNNDNLATPGEQQLEFVYIASKYAGLDLTDFFEKWGFLKEVDVEIDDYGKGQLTIKSNQAQAMRDKVKGLNLPKPTEAIEYISDNNYKYFKDRTNIVKGTSVRNGNTVTMTGWKNVVAYEVREGSKDGRLIAVSEGMNRPSNTASFEVRNGWNNAYKIFAVQYDNTRIEVAF